MAKVTAVRGKFDMDNLGLDRDGDVTFSPTNVRVTYAPGDYTDFGGSYAPGPGGTVIGTVTSITNVAGGKTTFTVTDANADAQTVFNYIQANDIRGAEEYILRDDDTLAGGGKADTLYGFGGADQIDGGAGRDVLVGGAGKDALTGGADADRFTYWAATDSGVKSSARDTILDFSHADGDRIDLKAIDADATTTDVNDKFHLVSAFTGHAGELVIVAGASGYVVQADTDGVGGADFAILVKSDTPLGAGDFSF